MGLAKAGSQGHPRALVDQGKGIICPPRQALPAGPQYPGPLSALLIGTCALLLLLSRFSRVRLCATP